MSKNDNELKKIAKEILTGTAEYNFDSTLELSSDEYDLSDEEFNRVHDLCNSATITVSWE